MLFPLNISLKVAYTKSPSQGKSGMWVIVDRVETIESKIQGLEGKNKDYLYTIQNIETGDTEYYVNRDELRRKKDSDWKEYV